MGVFVLALQHISSNGIIVLIVQVTSGIAIYFIWASLLRNPNFVYLMNVIKERKKKKNKV